MGLEISQGTRESMAAEFQDVAAADWHELSRPVPAVLERVSWRPSEPDIVEQGLQAQQDQEEGPEMVQAA